MSVLSQQFFFRAVDLRNLNAAITIVIAHIAQRTISSDIQENMLFDRLECIQQLFVKRILETAQRAPQSQFTPELEHKQK